MMPDAFATDILAALAQYAPDVLSRFLSASRELMSQLTLREASRHLPGICRRFADR